MKALSRSPLLLALAACSFMVGLPSDWAAHAADDPIISAPFTPLRKAPLFEAEAVPLAKTWGIALPIGTSFQVEKVYGRWIYGKPSPLKNMKAADYASPGWVYTRNLLLPGDADTLAPTVANHNRALLFHAAAMEKKLGLSQENSARSIQFQENLTLSKNTLALFSRPETQAADSAPWRLPAVIGNAFAEEEKAAPIGLTGTDLSFLQQEIKVEAEHRQAAKKVRVSKILKSPAAPPLDEQTRREVLGRYMLERYFELPPLNLEETDGFIYMRAIAVRALSGCPKPVQDFWKNRHWNFFRMFRLKSRPELKHPWLEIALPGGHFGVSGRAIELATNEAELAFLLVRQLVRELRVKSSYPDLKKDWPSNLPAQSEELWAQVLSAQSTKDSKNFDVSDEIEVDLQAAECLGRSGYRTMAAVAYMRKLLLNRELPWAEWYVKNSIGLEYRIERLHTLITEAVAHQKFPEGNDSQSKRFASASKQWNILP